MPPDAPLSYATATTRFIALVIDCVISMPVIWFVNRVIGSGAGSPPLLGQLLSAMYYVGFESSPLQATPGKMLLNIFLADKQGRRLSVLRALARYALYALPCLPLLLCVSSPEFATLGVKMARLRQAHDTVTLQAFWDDTAARSFFFWLLFSGIGGMALSATLIWLPIVASQEKMGMHDWITKVRVLQRREPRHA